MNHIELCDAAKHRRGRVLSRVAAIVVSLSCVTTVAGAISVEAPGIISPIVSLQAASIGLSVVPRGAVATTTPLEAVLSAASLSAQKNLIDKFSLQGKEARYSPVCDYNDEELYILSHLIAAEAGPNKTDELMVGAVFMNRVASPRFPNSMADVLKQSGQYACWSNGSWAAAKPSKRHIASAQQVLSGEFAIPANIVFQTGAPRASNGSYWFNVFMANENKPFSTHYYGCASSERFSSTDRFGRPVAADRAGVIENINYLLAQKEGINLETTLFIGDSLTVGLDNTVGLEAEYSADVNAVVGRGVRATMDSLENYDLTQYTDIVLTIGTNDATVANNIFEDNYEQLLLTISTRAPESELYVCTMPPIDAGLYYGTDKKSSSRVSNDDINEKNLIITSFQEEYQFNIVPLHDIVQENGTIRRSYTSDGLHLSRNGYTAWFEALAESAG